MFLFLHTFTKLRKATISFITTVCSSVCLTTQNNLAPTGRIFIKFYISVFLKNLSRKIQFRSNLTKIMKINIHFLIIPCSFIFRMSNVSDESCRENPNAHFMFNNIFFLNHAIYETMWKSIIKSAGRIIKRCMHIALWIPKATNTPSEYKKTYFFSTATMVAQRCLIVKLYIQCLSCFYYYYYLLCYIIAVRSLIAQFYVTPIQFNFLWKCFNIPLWLWSQYLTCGIHITGRNSLYAVSQCPSYCSVKGHKLN
jgi:hypothetical protein